MIASHYSWLQFDPEPLPLRKGDVLFAQGEAICNMHFVASGRIKLIRHTVDGDTSLLHIATAGEMIAEASLFSDNYHCSAVADRPSQIRRINRDVMLAQLLDNKQTSKAVLALFARQIRDLRGLIETRNIRSARQRILAYLNGIADPDGRAEIPFSVRDMAYKLGLAHETVYRELRQLEADASLRREGAGVFYL